MDPLEARSLIPLTAHYTRNETIPDDSSRVSPHFYNNEEEVDRVLDVLAR